MNEQIHREQRVHGKHWHTVHDGYFSDPAIAAPLVQKIQEVAGRSKPQTLIDLGGGTGFLLSRLLAAGLEPQVSLINLEASAAQLDVAGASGIRCCQGSVASFARADLGSDEGACLFMMRSVLHYFGQDGLRPVLRHLRAQAKPGEFFVHQTASFRRQQDANCLNHLYRLMKTPKWYPTVAFLRTCLRAEGWDVLEIVPAPPLRLSAEDLQLRYQLTTTEIREIEAQLSQRSRVPADVFMQTDPGFCAFLHYWIYVCTPAVA